uniref:Basic-leucine zipper transcription factor family protein n=1 Tax=Sesuvium portulacastrum TaxID=221166 RepID=A0A2I7ZAR2_SESPO|nr:basic-leucine zipper transcription factor family protein [Sesuvium portulacastrum]
MEENPISYDPQISNPNPNNDEHHDHIGLPIPPLDHDLLAGDLNFSGTGDEDNDVFPFDDVNFDFTFDDLTFADDLLLEPLSDISQQSLSPNSDENPNLTPRVYDCSSEESNCAKSNCNSPKFGSSKSHSNSGVSHDSGNNSDKDVSSSSFVHNNDNSRSNCDDDKDVIDEKLVKVEDEVKVKVKCMPKRKKEHELEESHVEGRTSKFRKSSCSSESGATSFDFGNGNGNEGDEDEKRKARLMRNRESAQLSRQRKKQYVEELEEKVRAMHSTITDLNSKISYVMSENASLRHQLSGGAVGGPPPPPGMYPMVPMPYPWMPCPPPYTVKPQGSHVPLVPIPRLKPQQPVSAPKVSKKSDGKKSEGKGKATTKKVVSVSLLGLLFFFVFFGGLVPMVNVRYGGGFGEQRGTVLMVGNHVERTGYRGGMGVSDGKFGHGRVLQQSNSSSGSDGGSSMGNSSEPLVASLYVPRNDKMVKIDGNLIIHSVLASEKAMASETDSGVKTSEETSLAIAGSYPPYPIPGSGRSSGRHPHHDTGRQRALGSGSSGDSKTSGSDGKLQQWFREGLAGPMLSSGMCTEVFQFDVSPAPGSIVPATSVSNTSSERRQNSTRPNKPRNRRILHGRPIPLDGHTLNVTDEHVQPHEQNDGLQSNKSQSSMVVSVLVDPREAGDGDGEGVIRSKTLSRIFVVVLIDSVKYVTYSCMLPFMGSGTHLVTT